MMARQPVPIVEGLISMCGGLALLAACDTTGAARDSSATDSGFDGASAEARESASGSEGGANGTDPEGGGADAMSMSVDAGAEAGTPCDAMTCSEGGGTSFSCGASATCNAATQVCEHVQGGAGPPGVNFFQCGALPSECASNVSCNCVVKALGGSSVAQCNEADGGVTIDISAP